MPQSYSGDLRERVIGTVEAGASRREAAELFEISVSSAIRWGQRWREEGSSEPKPRGGSCSALENHAERSPLADPDIGRCNAIGGTATPCSAMLSVGLWPLSAIAGQGFPSWVRSE
jgi:transposase